MFVCERARARARENAALDAAAMWHLRARAHSKCAKNWDASATFKRLFAIRDFYISAARVASTQSNSRR